MIPNSTLDFGEKKLLELAQSCNAENSIEKSAFLDVLSYISLMVIWL
jgi:hypothetical protein